MREPERDSPLQAVNGRCGCGLARASWPDRQHRVCVDRGLRVDHRRASDFQQAGRIVTHGKNTNAERTASDLEAINS